MTRCLWGGRQYNCSDIFQTRKNFEGFCCSFNYVRPIAAKLFEKSSNKRSGDETNFHNKILHVVNYGMEYGLSFRINNDLEDYFFTTIPSTGITVDIIYFSREKC